MLQETGEKGRAQLTVYLFYVLAGNTSTDGTLDQCWVFNGVVRGIWYKYPTPSAAFWIGAPTQVQRFHDGGGEDGVRVASKKASTSVPQTKKAEGSGKEAPARNRRYIPDTIQTSDDESSAPQDHGSNKSLKPAANPAARKSKAPAATAETIPKVKSKPKKTIVIDDDDEDNVPSQSDGLEDEQSEAQSQSEPEDPVLDIERECAQIIQPKRQPVAPDPEALFSSDDDDRKPRHRRQAFSSSMGSMPPDTDIDFDFEVLHQDDEDDADEESEDEDEEAEEALVVTKPKMSVQQLKYEEEKPVIRSSKAAHPSKKAKANATAESDWHPIAQLTFPATGGGIKLLEQNETLKAVIKGAIHLHVYEISFKIGYEGTVSRAAVTRRLLRKCAKKHNDGSHIERRAKTDLIFVRGGNLRSALRNSAISKVATHYELNKPGTTPQQVRAIVKQLLSEQRYIFPYAAAPDPRAATSTNTNAAAADGSPSVATSVVPDHASTTNPQDNTEKVVQKSTSPKNPKSFVATLPFLAPAIVDVIHDVWWKTGKSLGFKHVNDLRSHRSDRPAEVVLPDAMICLAAANVWAALLAYETGCHVPAKDFSQDRLENTYTSFLAVLNTQRSASGARFFNKTMHELYLKVSHSVVVAETTGSTNNIICLPVDSDLD
ncbi:hypothetical protein B0H19DRAFT_1277038 [Mycena capillaripes]|nr:hypothetical protein B0H19DRAFT_1277038 [Mycena capillaripes]